MSALVKMGISQKSYVSSGHFR